MMTLMDSVLCEANAATGNALVRTTSSAPPWASANAVQGDATTSANASSPDGGQSDAASTSSYVISSSNLMDSNCRGVIMDNISHDMETRDCSPQSTSFDGYDQQQFLMKKSHGNKPHRDPTSHRIIEKRRRDRMNNCLTNLSKLIPSAYLKKGRGRIEKTEIIEMAIRYMKHIELERRQMKREQSDLQEELMLDKGVGTDEDEWNAPGQQHNIAGQQASGRNFGERYKQGFFDCIAETLRFLAGAEGLVVNDQMKTQLLFHLREYFGRISDQTCSQQQSAANQTIGRSATVQEKVEDTDEPLNMSLKRPRLCASPRHPLPQASIVEMPSSSSIGSSGSNDTVHHGSQLRDILETKEPQCNVGAKVEPNQQQAMAHLPHSTMPSMFLQQKFANTAHIFEHKQASGATAGSTVADSDRSLSSLLTGSGTFPYGARSTCSSSATTTSQYPSSPGSSVNSIPMESPPGLHSPPLSIPQMPANRNCGFPVPVFALHPVGLFYVPLTVDSRVLDSTFNASVILSSGSENGQAANGMSAVHQMAIAAMSSITHPVTINVNFNFIPNMASVLATVQHSQPRATNSAAGSPPYSANPRTNNGVPLNNASYAPNLRLALKQ